MIPRAMKTLLITLSGGGIARLRIFEVVSTTVAP